LPEHETLVQGFAKTKERWDKPDSVKEHLEVNGFTDVQVESVSKMTRLDTLDELLDVLPSLMNIIYVSFWTEEQRATLQETALQTVTKYLREKYGEGPLEWEFIAICGLGRKPE
jgi:hypothetical protein